MVWVVQTPGELRELNSPHATGEKYRPKPTTQ